MLGVVKTFFEGLSAKEKKLVYLCGLVLGVMIFDRLVVGPIFHESRLMDEKIRDQITLTEKNLRILAYRERILEEDASYGEYYTAKGFSREVLIATFLGEVENIAKKAGITLSNIDPVEVLPEEGYSELSLTLECQGNMQNMVDFMYNIDNSKKPLRIRFFEMAVRNRENYEVRCGVTVVKTIIHRPEMVSETAPEKEEELENEAVFVTERVELQ
jgi:hypothetical protein